MKTKTKKQRQNWYKGLSEAEKENWIKSLKDKQAIKRKQKLKLVDNKYNWDCKDCIHSKTMNCIEIEPCKAYRNMNGF